MVFNDCISNRCNPEALQPEEELRLTKFLMDSAADAVFWVNSDARFLYVNNAACNLVEYSREELLSMTMHDLDPDFSPKIWSEYWRTIKQQGSLYFESLHQTKEGWSFPVEITVTYLEHYGREYGCIFVRDITKRKQAETALQIANQALECRVQESTAQLRNALEQLCREKASRQRGETELRARSVEQSQETFNADVGIAHVSIDGKWLIVNQKLCEIVGYTQQELQAQTFGDITHPDDLDANVEYIRRILAGEIQTYSIQKRYIRKDNSYVWINLTVSLVLSPSQPKYFIFVVQDISQPKQASALRHSEAVFRTLVETTNAMILIVSGTQLCYVNPATEAITGYKTQELLAYSNFYQLLNIKQRGQVSKRCEKEPQHQELKILTKSGEQRWLDWSEGVFEFQGKPAKLITAINITKRKQAQVKVRQALEQEKSESELRAQFVCMVSHEFRNPLHVISFSTSLLKRQNHQCTQEKKLKNLHRIQTAVEHLSELMDDVLIIGKSEAGKLKFEPRALDLEQFCRDLAAQLQVRNSSQHTVTFTSLGDCSTAWVDEKLLQPILTNLLDNAIKYSPQSSTVDFTLSDQDEQVIFQIKDQGIGIPAADQQRLFEPFHRGKNVGDIPGTGLGLAVVKKLVDLHCGQISLASEVGVGTTFTITLSRQN